MFHFFYILYYLKWSGLMIPCISNSRRRTTDNHLSKTLPKKLLRNITLAIHFLDKSLFNKWKTLEELILKGFVKIPGDDLLYHSVTRAVPLALQGLTSEFGMGSGVPPALWSPREICNWSARINLTQILKRIQKVEEKPDGWLVSLGWIRYRTYTCDLSIP